MTFDSGATYHSTNQNRLPGIQRAVVGSTDHGEYRPRCINLRHAAGHSPDAITCGDTRAGAYQNRSPAMFAIARSGENRISIVMYKQ